MLLPWIGAIPSAWKENPKLSRWAENSERNSIIKNKNRLFSEATFKEMLLPSSSPVIVRWKFKGKLKEATISGVL